jgi:hypothetical protein
LHEQVGGIRLLLNRLLNEPRRFRVLIDAPNLSELGKKVFEQCAFLGSHERPQ